MSPFRVNTEDPTNNKIHSVKNISINEFIGIWVTDEATSKQSRCLFQPQMLKKWWETDDLGRFCNHSFDPNTTVVPYSDKLILKACKMIKSNEEITVDYREITRFTGYLPYMDF